MLNEDTITADTGWNGAEYIHSFGRSVKDFSSTIKIHVNQKKKVLHTQRSTFTILTIVLLRRSVIVTQEQVKI